MVMVPASLTLAGSFAARAGSTAGALTAVVADAELELPSESESEPHAVNARAVVAMAATARARVWNMGVLSRGCTGRGRPPRGLRGRSCHRARSGRSHPPNYLVVG